MALQRLPREHKVTTPGTERNMADRPNGPRAGPTVVSMIDRSADDDTQELLTVLTGLDDAPAPAARRHRRLRRTALGLLVASTLLIGVTTGGLYALSSSWATT